MRDTLVWQEGRLYFFFVSIFVHNLAIGLHLRPDHRNHSRRRYLEGHDDDDDDEDPLPLQIQIHQTHHGQTIYPDDLVLSVRSDL